MGSSSNNNCGEVASALQKCIRRGLADDALFWATELDIAGFGGQFAGVGVAFILHRGVIAECFSLRQKLGCKIRSSFGGLVPESCREFLVDLGVRQMLILVAWNT